ncbi:hypothetical protein DLAC_07209 [Tieghemostelium lacteum]|uniref:Uncharacterized protein n=1 Tax=Tieghemostelium lacteum TaxID=361077 RepID=A0A151ZD46_TIELA|nr:hypothetical protein DLAC_07209 [Tieghemostelium lacteum]|eukprot:KYQ91873.1 hypothetical protein DLAC_07209 [Tieghemostelium lacteum]
MFSAEEKNILAKASVGKDDPFPIKDNFGVIPNRRCWSTSKFITNIFSNRNPNIGPLEHLIIFNSNIDDETLQYLIGTRSIKIFINHNITSKGISFLD